MRWCCGCSSTSAHASCSSRRREPNDGEGGDPVTFVASANLKRRHLDAGQKAMLGAALKPLYEEQARQNSLANLRRGESIPDPPILAGRGDARQQAARTAGVSHGYVQQAITIQKEAPDLEAAVRAGTQTLHSADPSPTEDVRQGVGPQQCRVQSRLLPQGDGAEALAPGTAPRRAGAPAEQTRTLGEHRPLPHAGSARRLRRR